VKQSNDLRDIAKAIQSISRESCRVAMYVKCSEIGRQWTKEAKIATIVSRAIRPTYAAWRYGDTLPTRCHPTRRCDLEARAVICGRHLRPPWWFRQCDELRSETELSPLRDLVHGTVFLNSSSTAHLLAPLENIFSYFLEHRTAPY